MTKDRKILFLGLFTALIVTLLDFLSKHSMLNYLKNSGNQELLPFFNLTLVHNKGISFGFMNGGSAIELATISLLTILIVTALLIWLFKNHSIYRAISIGLVIGGAFGNLIDRAIYGAVIDFLDFHLGKNHFPAFNLADSCIFIGVALLLLENIFIKEEVK